MVNGFVTQASGIVVENSRGAFPSFVPANGAITNASTRRAGPVGIQQRLDGVFAVALFQAAATKLASNSVAFLRSAASFRIYRLLTALMTTRSFDGVILFAGEFVGDFVKLRGCDILDGDNNVRFRSLGNELALDVHDALGFSIFVV